MTTKPMIYDADTGGQPEVFRYTVRALEQPLLHTVAASVTYGCSLWYTRLHPRVHTAAGACPRAARRERVYHRGQVRRYH